MVNFCSPPSGLRFSRWRFPLAGVIPAHHRLEWRPYRRRWRRPWVTAAGSWEERAGAWVRLTAPDGRTGYGEVAPLPGWGVEDAASGQAWLAAAAAGPVAEDQEVPAGWGALAFGLGQARAELAAGGLTGAIGVALHTRVPVAALLPAGEAAEAAMRAAVATGYSTFKWKIGVEPAAVEWARLERLLGLLPTGGRLRLDANGGLTPLLAVGWLERAEAATGRIEYLEEPLPGGAAAWPELRRLGEHYRTPLALDESVVGLPALDAAMAGGWRGLLVVKPTLAGDPVAVAQRLRRWAGRVVVSSAFETAVGFAGVTALAAVVAADRAAGLGTTDFWAEGDRLGPPGLSGPWRWVELAESARLWEAAGHD